MEKQLFLELLYLKRKDSDQAIQRDDSYNKLSTLISPRNAHQIIDKEDERIISRKTSFICDDTNDKVKKLNKSNSFISEQNDYFTNKSQQYFDKKMKEEISKSTGRKLKTSKEKSDNKDQIVSKIIVHMYNSQKKCELEKQKVKQELRKILYKQEENQSKTNQQSQNNFRRASQISLNNSKLNSPKNQLKKIQIQNKTSTNQLQQSDQQQAMNQNHQSTQKVNHNLFLRDKFQNNMNSQIHNNFYMQKQASQTQNFQTSFNDYVLQNNTDYDNRLHIKLNTSQEDYNYQLKDNMFKVKSSFHNMSKKGTLEYSLIFDENEQNQLALNQRNNISSIISQRKNSQRIQLNKQQVQQQKDSSLNSSYSELNQFYNTNNSDKSNNNSFIFDKIKTSRKSSHIFQQCQLNQSQSQLDTSFKKQTNIQSQKIEYFSQFNQILNSVQGVCSGLIDDAELYQDSTFIKTNLTEYKQKLEENKQVWLEDPRYIHVREKLRQNARKNKKCESNDSHDKFHPYFQFLGYDAVEKIPKKRSNQEIIEQRYAYFLHKNGVDLTHHNLNSQNNKYDNKIDEDLKLQQEKQEKKKKMMDKFLTILKQSKQKQKQYLKEANQKQNQQSQDMKSPKNTINLAKKQSNTTFIPLTSPRQQHRKYSFQSQDQTQNKSQNCSKRQSIFLNLALSPRYYLNQSIKTQNEDLIIEKTQTSEEFIKEIEQEEDPNNKFKSNEKIGEQEEVPIVRQILSRYGRINSNEADQVINKIKQWRQTEDQQFVTNKEFFLNKLQEQKQKIGLNLEKRQSDSSLLKQQTIEKIKKKFQSRQRVNIEKLYKSEKDIEKNLQDLKDTTQNIDQIIQSTKVGIHNFKAQNFNDLSIQVGGQNKLISSYAGQRLEYVKSQPSTFRQTQKSFKTDRNYY